MEYLIEKKNLFELDKKYKLVHCISVDYKMGAGIAVEFNKRFKLTKEFDALDLILPISQGCWHVGGVYNLITKEKYWHKPTYESLKNCLCELRESIIMDEVKYLAMPKIGCGLDKLKWDKVQDMIFEIFEDADVEILVCYL